MPPVRWGDDNKAFDPMADPEKIEEKMKERLSPFNANFAKLAETTLEAWHLPGVALAVIDGDETFAEVFIPKGNVPIMPF